MNRDNVRRALADPQDIGAWRRSVEESRRGMGTASRRPPVAVEVHQARSLWRELLDETIKHNSRGDGHYTGSWRWEDGYISCNLGSQCGGLANVLALACQEPPDSPDDSLYYPVPGVPGASVSWTDQWGQTFAELMLDVETVGRWLHRTDELARQAGSAQLLDSILRSCDGLTDYPLICEESYGAVQAAGQHIALNSDMREVWGMVDTGGWEAEDEYLEGDELVDTLDSLGIRIGDHQSGACYWCQDGAGGMSTLYARPLADAILEALETNLYAAAILGMVRDERWG